MKVVKVLAWAVGWILLAGGSEGLASDLGPLQQSLRAQLPRLQESAKAPSVHIVDIDSGEPVFNHYGNRARIVASNTKLFTSAAALDRLGPAFQFETRLLASGRIRGSVLEGDLVVVGAGDPNLSGRHYFGDSFAAFRPWARKLYQHGVRKVEGSVFLIRGLFEDQFVHPDWPKDQLSRWYEAPVAALSFNDACILVRVLPGGAPGAPARIETVPDLGIFDIQSTAKTVGSKGRHWIAIGREPGSHVVRISGQIRSGAGPVEKWVTVEDPVAYLGKALKDAFREEGVEIPSPEQRRTLPPGPWRAVTSHRSDLLTTLEVVNKRSQNLYAESVLKALGAHTCGSGTWAAGIQAVSEFLDSLEIEPGTYSLADGSGMSRQNRFTARQVTHLLREMFFHRWGPEFLRTLPYSGEKDLKWKKRLAEPPYRGNVFAKTGTLRGVSTLSGYAKGSSGRLYAFSILLNDTRNQWAASRAQDALLKALIDGG